MLVARFSNRITSLRKKHFLQLRLQSSDKVTAEIKKRVVIEWNKQCNQLYGPIIKNKNSIYNKEQSTPFPNKFKTKSENKESLNELQDKQKVLKSHNFTDVKNTRIDKSYTKTDGSDSKVVTTRECENLSSTVDDKSAKLDLILSVPIFHSGFDHQSESLDIRKLMELYEKPCLPASVSKILAETRPPDAQKALQDWENKMVDELSLEGFQNLKKEMFESGRFLHAFIEKQLDGSSFDESDIPEKVKGHWQSLKSVFPCVSDVKFQERNVTHPTLHYRGIFDCIAKYKGHPCLIDWKTSKKRKPSVRNTFENPVQVAAYLGAYHAENPDEPPVENTMIVVAYEDGYPADAHLISKQNTLQYWQLWLKKLRQYWNQQLVTDGPASL